MTEPKSLRSNSGLIRRKPASKRAAVREDQARFFASLIDTLVDDSADYFLVEPESVSCEDLFALPAYDRFIQGAYACGFVCTDFSPNFPLEAARTRPAETLGRVPFPALRHYIHTLLRAERHSYPYSEHVWDALRSGALALVSKRLREDDLLYESF